MKIKNPSYREKKQFYTLFDFSFCKEPYTQSILQVQHDLKDSTVNWETFISHITACFSCLWQEKKPFDDMSSHEKPFDFIHPDNYKYKIKFIKRNKAKYIRLCKYYKNRENKTDKYNYYLDRLGYLILLAFYSQISILKIFQDNEQRLLDGLFFIDKHIYKAVSEYNQKLWFHYNNLSYEVNNIHFLSPYIEKNNALLGITKGKDGYELPHCSFEQTSLFYSKDKQRKSLLEVI